MDAILLCAKFYHPSFKTVACIDGTKLPASYQKIQGQYFEGQGQNQNFMNSNQSVLMRTCCVPIFITLASKLWPVLVEQNLP